MHFPEKLKISSIKPVFKKGSKADPGNYCPISVLPTFSKIFEWAMCVRLTQYLKHHNLYDKEQHSFRVGKSVISASLYLIETIIETIDRGGNVAGVFIDLSTDHAN